LTATGDKYQRNVTYLFDNKVVLRWIGLTVIIESHCNIKVVVTKPMHGFLGEIEAES